LREREFVVEVTGYLHLSDPGNLRKGVVTVDGEPQPMSAAEMKDQDFAVGSAVASHSDTGEVSIRLERPGGESTQVSFDFSLSKQISEAVRELIGAIRQKLTGEP
jgi:hypothetical protein